MKQRSLLPLLGVIFIIALFFLLVELARPSGMFLRGFISPPTALITFGIASLLYTGSFRRVDKKQRTQQLYKCRWILDVLILTGIYGAMMGFLILLNSIQYESETITSTLDLEIPEILALGSAASLLSILYALVGAISIYFIEKHIRFAEDDEEFVSHPINHGINLRSAFALVGVVVVSLGAAFLSSVAAGTDIWGIINFNIVYFLGAVFLISIYIFDGESIVFVFTLPLWRKQVNADLLLRRLNVLRGCKRIISVLMLIAVSAVPIYIMVSLGEEMRMVATLGKSAAVILWASFLLLYLYLSEGQLVQQIYYQTGAIHYDDNWYLMKFVVPSFILWMVMQGFVFVVFLII